jgi:hypothetical protein
MNGQVYSALLLSSVRGLNPAEALTWLEKYHDKSLVRGFFRNPAGNGFTCMKCGAHREGLRAMQRHVSRWYCEPRPKAFSGLRIERRRLAKHPRLKGEKENAEKFLRSVR